MIRDLMPLTCTDTYLFSRDVRRMAIIIKTIIFIGLPRVLMSNLLLEIWVSVKLQVHNRLTWVSR